MIASNEAEKFEQVARRIDHQSKLLRTWPLKGGVSAQVTVMEVGRPNGETKKMIVRQHGDQDLKQNPHIAADEFRLLQILQSVGLAAPAPYYVDESGEIFSTPYIVIEYVEGATEFTPTNLADLLLQLSTHLSRIHGIDCSLLDLSFLPMQEQRYAEKFRERPVEIDESLGEGRIRDTLASVWPLPQRNKPVLLHGDFWPGNILWRDGQLVAVIDWEDAQLGDPLTDLANSRIEILWAFGRDAMHRFTQHYKSLAGVDFTDLPYWDLCAAQRHALKSVEWSTYEINEKTMRDGHRWFVKQAFKELSDQSY